MAKQENNAAGNALGTRKELDEKIKNGDIAGIFFLYGDEEYMVDFYVNKLKAACGADKSDDAFGGNFDEARFTDADFSPDSLYSAMLAYPMGTKHKFIEVRDVNLSKSAGDKKIWSNIFNLESDCCVVFTKKGSDLKGESALGALKTSANLFTVEFALNDLESLAKWLKKIFSASKIEISPQNINYMLSFGARDMYGLKNEADKLINYKLYQNTDGAEREVSKAEIDLIVCKTNELQAFELANAVLDGKFDKAVLILKKLEFLREEPVTIVSQIGRVFCDLKVLAEIKDAYYSDPKLIAKQIRMHEYKIKLYLAALGRNKRGNENFLVNAVELAAQCDIVLKSLYADGYIILYNLIYNLWAMRTSV